MTAALAIAIRDASWVCVTLVTYIVLERLNRQERWPLFRLPVFHPLVTSVLVLGLIVRLGGVSQDFQSGTEPLSWLINPAVMVLGFLIYQQWARIVAQWPALAAAATASVLLSTLSILVLSPIFGITAAEALSVRSVTAPVALGIASGAGLSTDIALAGVVASGLVGLIAGPTLLKWFGHHGDRPEVGIALGMASHGLGIARAIDAGTTATAFASLSMAVSAINYGLIMPYFFQFIS